MNIFEAIKQGDLETIIILIRKNKVDTNYIDEEGRTVLHYAALKGHLDIVKAFIKFGAEVDARDRRNVTPLWLTTVSSYQDIAIELLKHGANPNAKDQVGNSVLHIAASNNNLAIVKLLIEYGGNINAVNDFNWAVIHSAAFGIIEARGNWEVMEYLLEHNADYLVKDKDGISVRDLFSQEDYFYTKYYDRLVRTTIGSIK